MVLVDVAASADHRVKDRPPIHDHFTVAFVRSSEFANVLNPADLLQIGASEFKSPVAVNRFWIRFNVRTSRWWIDAGCQVVAQFDDFF